MFNIWAILSLFKEFGYKKVLKLQAVLHIEYLEATINAPSSH